MASDAPAFIDVQAPGGQPRLPDLDLWLDPHRARGFAFVSHAHSDHFAPHRRILCSTETKTLLQGRFGAREAEFLDAPLGGTLDLAGYRLRLLPAGHIAGSAQLHAERLSDGATLVYTGDFKLRRGLAAEPIEIRRADTVIMETTFGLPRYRLPPAGPVIASMAKWMRETLEEDAIPVFLAYSLGKAQELLLALHAAAPEAPWQLHPAAARMTSLLSGMGWSFPPFAEFRPGEVSPQGHAVILPPAAGRGQAARRLKNARFAVATGWALDPGARYRHQADEAFPLSDHAGYDDLLAYVEQAAPRRVLTLHGYAKEFAADLRARGLEAWSIAGSDQIELALEFREPARDREESGALPRPGGGFSRFAEICEAIADATGKRRKREILAPWLAGLKPADAAIAARFLSGRPWGRGRPARSAQAGWAVIRRALRQVSGLSEAEFRALSASQADAGRTARLALQAQGQARPWALAEVAAFFDALASARGPAAKVDLLAEHLRAQHHADGGWVVRLLTGDLRAGLKEGLLEEALADAFGATADAIREAHMVTGDLGETARLAAGGELHRAEAAPFVPLRCMLASPEESGESIWKRLAGNGAEGGAWLEDKFDGIRAQLHRSGDRVEIFSRDLRPLHGEFAELLAPARILETDVILDGEIIAWAEGKKLTFFDLQKRLGRRRAEGDLFSGEAVPVRYLVFDLLWAAGESLLGLPLAERRVRLDALSLPPGFERAAVHRAGSPEEIEAACHAARRRGNEGLIAKDPASPYQPGRRGKAWLKLKKAAATLDVVVVQAEQGHGKRSHVLSDYTFAVRDEAAGNALRVIGKAYSGLTDAEIEELTERFESLTVEKRRRARVVSPQVVLEIAFDSIQPSGRHDSGLALRFPRIKAIRRDKGPEEIDTLAYARRLAGVDPPLD